MPGPVSGLSRTFDASFENGEFDLSESAQLIAILGDDLRFCVAEQALSTRCTESAGQPVSGEHVTWTNRTITNLTELREHIEAVRCQGFALDDEEMYSGMRCLAAPIYDYRRMTVAAISVVGPVTSMSDENLPELATVLSRIASVICEQLGYRPAQ